MNVLLSIFVTIANTAASIGLFLLPFAIIYGIAYIASKHAMSNSKNIKAEVPIKTKNIAKNEGYNQEESSKTEITDLNKIYNIKKHVSV